MRREYHALLHAFGPGAGPKSRCTFHTRHRSHAYVPLGPVHCCCFVAGTRLNGILGFCMGWLRALRTRVLLEWVSSDFSERSWNVPTTLGVLVAGCLGDILLECSRGVQLCGLTLFVV